ncbi:MAG: N-acetylmuramoyl-L-alanine amidase [Magnetovibrio sp.]|nr:N-acetylmuramoyl-L-alanine amidase [Magnetovibrio sp.]
MILSALWKIRLHIIAIFTIFVLAGSSNAYAVAVTITDIRVGQTEKTTRLVLDVDQPIDASLFYLGNPNRVVLDLPQVGWRLPHRPLPKNIGVLSSIRYGLFRPGNSRLVIDLVAPSKISKAWFIPYDGERPFRLVLDMTRVSQNQFFSYLSTPSIKVARRSGENDKKQMVFKDSNIIDNVNSDIFENNGSTVHKKQENKNSSYNSQNIISVRQTKLKLPPRKPERNTLVIKRKIVIDPGHGGVDPGAIGRAGTYEKYITLGFGRELVRALRKSGRYEAVLTRDRDKYIPLRKRVAIAREARADLFISLHADSIKNKNIRGVSVYTLSETASDKEAAELAAKENKADLIFGKDFNNENPEVTNILIDLAQRETMNRSARFANLLILELRKSTEILRRTHRFAGFRVLKAPDVPSILLELGFLSNRRDEVNLRSKKYRRKISAAIITSIDNYFERIEAASR